MKNVETVEEQNPEDHEWFISKGVSFIAIGFMDASRKNFVSDSKEVNRIALAINTELRQRALTAKIVISKLYGHLEYGYYVLKALDSNTKTALDVLGKHGVYNLSDLFNRVGPSDPQQDFALVPVNKNLGPR